jgi:hypothetical protein
MFWAVPPAQQILPEEISKHNAMSGFGRLTSPARLARGTVFLDRLGGEKAWPFGQASHFERCCSARKETLPAYHDRVRLRDGTVCARP